MCQTRWMNGTNMEKIFLQLFSLALFHNMICPKKAQQTTIYWMFFARLTMTCFVFKIFTAWVWLDIYSSGYVAKIYDILITTPREDLDTLKDELTAQVPEPLHSLLKDKESKAEAQEKYLSRKKRETVICPPTCSGTVHSQHGLVCSKTCRRKNEHECDHSNHIELIVLIEWLGARGT